MTGQRLPLYHNRKPRQNPDLNPNLYITFSIQPKSLRFFIYIFSNF